MDYSKVEKLLDKFYEEVGQDGNAKKPPKLWNLDTCVFNQWERFSQNLKSNDIKKGEAIECVVKCVAKNPKNGAPRYLIYINQKDITPFTRSKNKLNWSLGGTRQFLQVGSALDIIYSDCVLDRNEKKYDISSEVNEFLNDEVDWDTIIYKVIKRSFTTSIQFIRNFGFSLFISILFSFDNEIFNKLKSRLFYKRMTKTIKNKNENKKNPFLSKEEYCKKYLAKIYEETYNNLITNFKKKNNVLELFIENVYSEIFDCYEVESKTLGDELDCKIKNFIRRIKEERSEFKNNMILDRFSFLENKPQDYSDLIDEETNEIYKRPWSELEAAHLYEVRKIKKDGIDILMEKHKINPIWVEEKLREMIPCASNPKNGIFIPSNIHKAFDNGEIGFNSNGKMIVQKEEIEKYYNKKLIISPKIFDEEMKNFLNKR